MIKPLFFFLAMALLPVRGAGPWWPEPVAAALSNSAGNLAELTRALTEVPEAQRTGMGFLIENMPVVDLQSLKADFLLDHVARTYQTMTGVPWSQQVPPDIFLNDILPYASLNEARDGGRQRMREIAAPLVKECQTPGEAAMVLNQKLFGTIKVKYSTTRRKPDQSALESMQSGVATCSGLSILLVDACRAVGVPARVVGTPMWTNLRGNHTWVEVWDGDWKFAGAAEPDAKGLNHGWFAGDAAKAVGEVPRHAIYASSFKKTGLSFPLVWDRGLDWVGAVNVTARYARNNVPVPAGKMRLLVKVLDRPAGQRVAAKVTLVEAGGGAEQLEGVSRDEQADLNNILPFTLEPGREYFLRVEHNGKTLEQKIQTEKAAEQTVIIPLASASPDLSPLDLLATSAEAVVDFKAWVAPARDLRPDLQGTAFAGKPLSKADAASVQTGLWEDHEALIRETRAIEMAAKTIELKGKVMKFETVDFPAKTVNVPGGRSLFISMHGGGGAPPQVNESQWRNQIKLGQGYAPEEGIYLAPRAPTDTWNLWHEAHIDAFFDRIIENLVVLEKVNPDRVYLLGYSAGGDGVYQLAPRMADRWAAVSMMAGHPNETSPVGLRNVPFALQVGGNDAAYRRNEIAAEWGRKLDALQQEDPSGYPHFTEVHAGKGHWMEMADRKAIPWMEKYTRQPFPEKIVWRQDDVTHIRFYWLEVPGGQAAAGQEITAVRSGQTITLTASAGVRRVTVLLNDAMLDLDQPVIIQAGGTEVFSGRLPRTAAILERTLSDRGDPRSVFSAGVTVSFP
jgi:hypothetical protein